MADQGLLPLALKLPPQRGLYKGAPVPITLRSAVTVFLGPNAAGKSVMLRALGVALHAKLGSRKVRLLSAGRIADLERFRSNLSPGGRNESPAAIGHIGHIQQRWHYEGIAGDLIALDQRPDLFIKVRVRLETYLGRQLLRLRWVPTGLQPVFAVARSSDAEYFANAEASGLLHVISLSTALYDDEIALLLIDGPETSLHPQLQSFLLEEFRKVAGDPTLDGTKKLIIISTHSPNFLACGASKKYPIWYSSEQLGIRL